MSDYERVDYSNAQPRPWLRAFIPFAVVFVAGLLTMGWVLTRWDAAAPYLTWMRQPPPAPRVVAPNPPQLIVAAGPDTAPLERRVSQLDNRVEDIAERAEAASGNADRAEGLLVAFAARRAIDRGLRLGYIEGLLSDRFGRDQPQAVATIISAARQPVTLEEIRAELDAIAPDLIGPGGKASWWDGVQRELAGLIVVRREDMPSATPDARIARAKRELDAGHVERALAEIARLPARDRALPWINRARRYVSVHNALDLIETSALLTPAPEAHLKTQNSAG
jgi:hypothetical protein